MMLRPVSTTAALRCALREIAISLAQRYVARHIATYRSLSLATSSAGQRSRSGNRPLMLASVVTVASR